MARLAVIGGSGFARLAEFTAREETEVQTPYGNPSAPVLGGTLSGHALCFLARHGQEHRIPPHRINYRANLWALRRTGAEAVIAIAAVGGVTNRCRAGTLVVPDQIIDYTWGREHTYFDGGEEPVTHAEFTQPYCNELRELIIKTGAELGFPLLGAGCYAATQGPRFESAAEINRLESDGADIVGMTGMPEASLARELGLCYATIAIVVNPAAGRGDGMITAMEIENVFSAAQEAVTALLCALIPRVAALTFRTPEPVRP